MPTSTSASSNSIGEMFSTNFGTCWLFSLPAYLWFDAMPVFVSKECHLRCFGPSLPQLIGDRSELLNRRLEAVANLLGKSVGLGWRRPPDSCHEVLRPHFRHLIHESITSSPAPSSPLSSDRRRRSDRPALSRHRRLPESSSCSPGGSTPDVLHCPCRPGAARIGTSPP